MEYEITTTNVFDKWLRSIKSKRHRARIFTRFDNIHRGNFGDRKSVGRNLFELRFFFGSGYRIYYTIRDKSVVLLLCGGDKSSQQKDVQRAKEISGNLE